jgi:lipoprotein-releasing system permease protein
MTPFVAFRHLRFRARSTLLTAAGVALGVAVMITMASLLLGLQEQFMRNVVEATPNVLVDGEPVNQAGRAVAVPAGPDTVVELSRRPPPRGREDIDNYRIRLGQIEAIPGVTAASPSLDGQALLRYGARAQPVSMSGIVPEQQGRTTVWESRLRASTGDLTTTANGVVLGIILAQNMGIPPGATVTLTTGPARERRLRVVAFYESGVRQVDESVVYVNLSTAQALLDKPTAVSSIAVRVVDPDQAPAMARQISAVTGLRARSWQAINANFFAIFALQNSVTGLMIAFIVLISGFGIANGLIAIILEKQRDIGILKALGARRERIAAIFLLEGLLMGLLGAAVGIGLAGLATWQLGRTSTGGQGALSTSSTFTMLQTPAVYLIPALIAIAISILASLLPVRRAVHYDPVEIIRSAK